MPEPTTYDLHKLGWRAFQDLSSIILQQVLGQTFHAFADSNDGGRDGAFYGKWRTERLLSVSSPDSLPHEITSSPAVVAQCKFSAIRSGTLPPSALIDELDKVQRLQQNGFCEAYLLLTNLRVTGNTEAWLHEELTKRGVSDSLVLDGTWICQQISANPVLRRHVPRVYGLGDLSQILDERRLQQANALMSRLREDLLTFVPTSAYRQAADALAQYGFTILLGAPAVGKSTIAATLSLAALDEWNCNVMRVDSAAELIAAWNPTEPEQLFWIDDAFGAIRHDRQLTDEWSRRLDQVMTAVRNGARVILTSRDYIYRDARVHLKEYAYPLLREHAIVVDVAALTDSEKRRILYNHLKAGDQPPDVLKRWRSVLPSVATSQNFQPEVARRLGLTAFTTGIHDRSSSSLRDYVDRPVDFLRDVLSQLDSGSHAALACVYLSGDGLPAPFNKTSRLEEAIDRMGASIASVFSALTALDGTFLILSRNVDGSTEWRFRHPTIREGFAAMIAGDPNSLGILLDGLKNDELLHQVDCGSDERGTLIQIPPSLYEAIARRIPPTSVESDSWHNPLSFFLRHRCSDQFLRIWSEVHAGELSCLLHFGAYIEAFWQPAILGRLQRAGALLEQVRTKARESLEAIAIDDFDAGWLGTDVADVFTDEERRELLERVRLKHLVDIESTISYFSDGYSSTATAEERYRPLVDSLTTYVDAFDFDKPLRAELKSALATIEATMSEDDEVVAPTRPSFSPTTYSDTPSARDEFDDVECGRD